MATFKPLPPKESLEYWAGKKAVTAKEFYKLEAEARARAFTVSGVNRLDQVQAMQESLEQALKNGMAFGEWKKQAEKIVGKGYDEWPHKLDNVFRTNVQNAYQVGRYKQMMEVVEDRPFWQYSAVCDRRTRPSHLALHGRVVRADDPFWDTYYPPNGFRCRCTVKTLSEGQVERRGLSVESPKTGDMLEVKGGTMKGWELPLQPDKHFNGNPAKSVWQPDWEKYDPKLAQATKKSIESGQKAVAANKTQKLPDVQKGAEYPGYIPAHLRKNRIVERCLEHKIEYNPITDRKTPLSVQEAIAFIGQKDLLGRCASQAYAYIGNRAGWKVRDFRTDYSRIIFAENGTHRVIAQLSGVDGIIMTGKNEQKVAQSLLKNMKPGKEYLLSVGEHNAIVRITPQVGKNHWEYLELQNPEGGNGYKPFYSDTLKRRFKCSSQRTFKNFGALIDIDKLSKSKDFKFLLGFLNTIK